MARAFTVCGAQGSTTALVSQSLSPFKALSLRMVGHHHEIIFSFELSGNRKEIVLTDYGVSFENLRFDQPTGAVTRQTSISGATKNIPHRLAGPNPVLGCSRVVLIVKLTGDLKDGRTLQEPFEDIPYDLKLIGNRGHFLMTAGLEAVEIRTTCQPSIVLLILQTCQGFLQLNPFGIVVYQHLEVGGNQVSEVIRVKLTLGDGVNLDTIS